MNALNRMVMLESSADEVLDGDPKWLEWARVTQKCRMCARPPVGYYPKPLEAVVVNRQRASIALADPVVTVLRRALFERLLPALPLMIPGPVRRRVAGKALVDFVTVHFPPDPMVPLRGGPGSREKRAYGVCSECGRWKSSEAMFTDPWNVLRMQLPVAPVVIANEGIILMPEHVAHDLRLLHDFPDLTLRPILVVDEAFEYVPELGDSPRSGV